MNDILTQLAKCLVKDTNGVSWDKIEYELMAVDTFWQETAEYYEGNSVNSVDTTSERKNPTGSPKYYAKQLRQAMYDEAPGKGAWYTLNLTVHRDGKFKLDVDYDQKPNFNIEIEEDRYRWDFEKYPRDAASTPDWLQLILSRKAQQP